MKTADLIIIGGGMVGLTLAAGLAETDCQIKIIEKHPPTETYSGQNQRVSAINRHSQAILKRAGVWEQIVSEGCAEYKQMDVWEKDSFAKICFSHQEPAIRQLNLNQLGFIIENDKILSALWHKVMSLPNVEVIAGSPKQMGVSENGAFLTLENGEMLSAKLIVGADGANSWVRRQSNIPLIRRDYQHTALVCQVKTALPHAQTAYQIFEPESILAFLPLAEENLCSIVWSLPPKQAELLLECDNETFNRALTIAFDNRLGLCEVQSSRAVYPLVARYARDFATARLALIGDAAHTIHPLAGLGVNLGLADAEYLAEQIKQHLYAGLDIGEYRHLRQFERVRKLEAVKLLVAMEGIKQLFSGSHPLKKLIRGIGLSVTNQAGLLKKLLIEQATEV